MRARLAAWLLAALASPVAVGAQDAAPEKSHEAFATAIITIQVALENREFAKLEQLHDELLASRERTTDGTWMIESFERAFDGKFDIDGPARLEDLFDAWRKAALGSKLRPVAEAFMWQNRAWRAHGVGCSARTIAQGKKVFAADLEQAAKVLAQNERGTSPLWYTVAIRVAAAQRLPRRRIDGILEEGARRYPGYRPIYWARLASLLPAWGGKYAEVDGFVRRAALRTRATEGMSFYAGLYVDLVRNTPCGNPLMESGASWPDMKQGFADMIERHDSPWNWNLFATFACRARDEDALAWALSNLGSEAKLGTYSPGISNETCRALIRPAPAPSRVTLLERVPSPGDSGLDR